LIRDAQWIWAKGLEEAQNAYVYARREFEVESLRYARALVTCSSEYKLYINGRYVGRGPGPCDPSRQFFDDYEARRYLTTGKNVVAALCYNYGVGTHFRPVSPGGFMFELEIDGQVIVTTDSTWKVIPAPEWDRNSTRMFWTVGFQEVHDSRLKPVGWNVVGFDDSKWEEPAVVGPAGCTPWIELVPRQVPRLSEREIVAESVLKCESIDPENACGATSTCDDPTIIHPGQKRSITFDFGGEVVGYPILRIRDGGGGVVDLDYSEAMNAAGDVDPMRQNVLQSDRLTLHGGRQEWETFGRRAFRYMRVSFREVDSPIALESASVRSVGYPINERSFFECSDDLLNHVWQVGVRTLALCMQDQFEDCPLRERGQYVADARVEALINYYCFSDYSLAAKAIRQFVEAQSPDGLFHALWPSNTRHVLPDYNLVWVIMLHDYVLHSGDRDLAGELYPGMRRLLDGWFVGQQTAAGLIAWDRDDSRPLHEWWLFIDHAKIDKRGEVAAYNAFYYRALRDAAGLALLVGESDDARRWHDRAGVLKRAFNERFWDERTGVYMDCFADGALSESVSIHANALAVAFGLADVDRIDRVWNYIDSGAPRVASSGPYFNFYVLQALAASGRDSQALELIRDCWGGMLSRGATEWWEWYDPGWESGKICPDSLCHGWSGAPTYFLPAEVLGVRPSAPGSDEVTIQPRPGDLEWARGRIDTHSGPVEVEWRREPGRFTIEINATSGFSVAVPLRGFVCPRVDEIDLTPETPERKARRTFGWGTVIWRDGEERDPYLEWLNSQEEEPPSNYTPADRCALSDGYLWITSNPSPHLRYEVRENGESEQLR